MQDGWQVPKTIPVVLYVVNITGSRDTPASTRGVGSSVACTEAEQGVLGCSRKFRRRDCPLRNSPSNRQWLRGA